MHALQAYRPYPCHAYHGPSLCLPEGAVDRAAHHCRDLSGHGHLVDGHPVYRLVCRPVCLGGRHPYHARSGLCGLCIDCAPNK